MKNQLELANNTIQTSRKNLDFQFYPQYHLAPFAGWMNDPNGLIYHQGQYHAFYQHHPFSASWGPMHWGHATSTDMVHWQHQPIALAPSEEYDRDGCFSGSAVSHNGELYLFYTGHIWLGNQGDDSQIIQSQCVAISTDGIHFEKKELSFRQLKGLCISVIQKFGSKTISGGWWSVQEIPIIMVKYSYLALQTY